MFGFLFVSFVFPEESVCLLYWASLETWRDKEPIANGSLWVFVFCFVVCLVWDFLLLHFVCFFVSLFCLFVCCLVCGVLFVFNLMRFEVFSEFSYKSIHFKLFSF